MATIKYGKYNYCTVGCTATVQPLYNIDRRISVMCVCNRLCVYVCVCMGVWVHVGNTERTRGLTTTTRRVVQYIERIDRILSLSPSHLTPNDSNNLLPLTFLFTKKKVELHRLANSTFVYWSKLQSKVCFPMTWSNSVAYVGLYHHCNCLILQTMIVIRTVAIVIIIIIIWYSRDSQCVVQISFINSEKFENNIG